MVGDRGGGGEWGVDPGSLSDGVLGGRRGGGGVVSVRMGSYGCVRSVGSVSRGEGVIRHTPSTAFRHLPPNSARSSYATEGALFISAQLSSDAVSALRKIWVLIRLWRQPSPKART